MAVTDSTLQRAWTPEGYGRLVDTVLANEAAAFKVAIPLTTENEQLRLPMLTADPAVNWVPENTQITLTDPATDELVISRWPLRRSPR